MFSEPDVAKNQKTPSPMRNLKEGAKSQVVVPNSTGKFECTTIKKLIPACSDFTRRRRTKWDRYKHKEVIRELSTEINDRNQLLGAVCSPLSLDDQESKKCDVLSQDLE